MSERADVAVIGGGLAGAAVALRLARAGATVTLLEREATPKPKVCGEFLSNVSLAELAALDFPARRLGAVPLSRTRFATRGRVAESPLGFAAASLSRERLDEALLAEAGEAGGTIVRGVTVRSIIANGTDWWVRHDGGDVRAGRVVVASGKADFPGRRRGRGVHDTLVGLKRYATLSPSASAALRDAVEVALFPGGYCGIQPMEDGRANVCLVVERAFLKARRGCPDAAFEAVRRGAERAGDLLAGARFDSARPLAVGRLPYGFVRTRSDGAFHLGDQAAVIPSFCGEGMAIALASARLAADAILAGEEADIFQRRFARRVAARVKAAALLSRLICRGPVQPLLAATAPVAPPILARLATLTRIPADAKPAGAF